MTVTETAGVTDDRAEDVDPEDVDTGPTGPTVKRVSIDVAGVVVINHCGEPDETTVLVTAVAVDGWMELVIENGRAWFETSDVVLAKTVGGETVVYD